MDYKDLLKKYMRHILNWEGTAFATFMDGSEITIEEQEEIKRIAKELEDE